MDRILRVVSWAMAAAAFGLAAPLGRAAPADEDGRGIAQAAAPPAASSAKRRRRSFCRRNRIRPPRRVALPDRPAMPETLGRRKRGWTSQPCHPHAFGAGAGGNGLAAEDRRTRRRAFRAVGAGRPASRPADPARVRVGGPRGLLRGEVGVSRRVEAGRRRSRHRAEDRRSRPGADRRADRDERGRGFSAGRIAVGGRRRLAPHHRHPHDAGVEKRSRQRHFDDGVEVLFHVCPGAVCRGGGT